MSWYDIEYYLMKISVSYLKFWEDLGSVTYSLWKSLGDLYYWYQYFDQQKICSNFFNILYIESIFLYSVTLSIS